MTAEEPTRCSRCLKALRAAEEQAERAMQAEAAVRRLASAAYRQSQFGAAEEIALLQQEIQRREVEEQVYIERMLTAEAENERLRLKVERLEQNLNLLIAKNEHSFDGLESTKSRSSRDGAKGRGPSPGKTVGRSKTQSKSVSPKPSPPKDRKSKGVGEMASLLEQVKAL